ncbi:uncharacterized protein LOC121855683 [Homarus americanus]|uniref:uncharacterized protein LOC121855683 n=1 Tax=Homarus americanus TaxID=6706 RepID=UPI001C48FBF4|nr:uncharacterized protein LOC121855683 [Homarus americanus]
MRLVLAGQYSFITTKFQSDYVVASRYTDRFGYTPIHSSATIYPKFAGTSWAVRKGAPFRRRMTSMTQRLIEAGLITHWLKDVIATRVRHQRTNNISSPHWPRPSQDDQLVELSLEHLKAGFILLVVGHCLACLTLLGELRLVRRVPHRTL